MGALVVFSVEVSLCALVVFSVEVSLCALVVFSVEVSLCALVVFSVEVSLCALVVSLWSCRCDLGWWVWHIEQSWYGTPYDPSFFCYLCF